MACGFVASTPSSLRMPTHTARCIVLSLWLQLAVKDLFVRGSVIRYVMVPPEEVDTALLQDAARVEALGTAKLAASKAPAAAAGGAGRR